MKNSLVKTKKVSIWKSEKTSIVFLFFDVIGMVLVLYCNTHTDCKQQHFLTRKQSKNPPIKSNFNPASPYSGCFLHILFFPLSLKGNSAVWWMSGLSDPPRYFGPALTFCWAKNKVHRVQTESFAALIPRKWNFTLNPKQTRPHISLHYLNELIEYRKPYQVDIQCTLLCIFENSDLLIHEKKHQKTALCELFCLLSSQSWWQLRIHTDGEKKSHFAREIRSAQSKKVDHAWTVQHTKGKHTVNIMQSYFYSQPLSTLSSRKTVNSTQPYQVSTLAQDPDPLRPRILCAININKLQIPFPQTKTKGEQEVMSEGRN